MPDRLRRALALVDRHDVISVAGLSCFGAGLGLLFGVGAALTGIGASLLALAWKGLR